MHLAFHVKVKADCFCIDFFSAVSNLYTSSLLDKRHVHVKVSTCDAITQVPFETREKRGVRYL